MAETKPIIPGPASRTALVLPAYNEAPALARTLERARRAPVDEIIIVDDGSTDTTGAIARRHAALDPRIKLVSHASNRGAGAARKTGVEASSAAIVVFFDCDVATIDAGQIEALRAPVAAGTADYVVADFGNFGRVTEYAARPLLKLFVPPLAALGQPLSGMFASRREFLFPERMGGGYTVIAMLLDAHFAGARIAEAWIGELRHRKRDDAEKVAQAEAASAAIIRILMERKVICRGDILAR